MSLTADNAREFWNQRYDNEHTPWDRGSVSPALVEWLEAGVLAPPASVLVPGCGRGHEVLELARHGFDVTAVDLSPAALAALRQRLGAADLDAVLTEGDLLTWEAGRRFDVVYEQTCLCALLPENRAQYEHRLRHWVKPGGMLLALFMQSDKHDDPPFHCPIPEMHRLFPAQAWDWPGEPPARVPHPAGVFEYAVALRRRPDAV